MPLSRTKRVHSPASGAVPDDLKAHGGFYRQRRSDDAVAHDGVSSGLQDDRGLSSHARGTSRSRSSNTAGLRGSSTCIRGICRARSRNGEHALSSLQCDVDRAIRFSRQNPNRIGAVNCARNVATPCRGSGESIRPRRRARAAAAVNSFAVRHRLKSGDVPQLGGK